MRRGRRRSPRPPTSTAQEHALQLKTLAEAEARRAHEATLAYEHAEQAEQEELDETTALLFRAARHQQLQSERSLQRRQQRVEAAAAAARAATAAAEAAAAAAVASNAEAATRFPDAKCYRCNVVLNIRYLAAPNSQCGHFVCGDCPHVFLHHGLHYCGICGVPHGGFHPLHSAL